MAVKDKLRSLTFDELRALFHELTGKRTTVGEAANTVTTRAAAFRRLVGKCDALITRLAELDGTTPELVFEDLVDQLNKPEQAESEQAEPEQAELIEHEPAKKPVKKPKKRVKRLGAPEPEPKKPDQRRRTPDNVEGISRPCKQCGATGLHKCCPRCGEAANGAKDIDEVFGFRAIKNAAGVATYRPQTWCRSCRAADVAERRAKRSEAGEASRG